MKTTKLSPGLMIIQAQGEGTAVEIDASYLKDCLSEKMRDTFHLSPPDIYTLKINTGAAYPEVKREDSFYFIII